MYLSWPGVSSRCRESQPLASSLSNFDVQAREAQGVLFQRIQRNIISNSLFSDKQYFQKAAEYNRRILIHRQQQAVKILPVINNEAFHEKCQKKRRDLLMLYISQQCIKKRLKLLKEGIFLKVSGLTLRKWNNSIYLSCPAGSNKCHFQKW